MLSKILDYIYLLFYFHLKRKNGFIVDIIVPIWRAKLTSKDIHHFTISFRLKEDIMLNVVVIDVKEPHERISKDVSLDIVSVNDYVKIVDCSFREFRQFYGETILELRSIDRVMDIYGR